MNFNFEDFTKEIPKAELHLHLEGAIPLETLYKLINRSGNTEIKSIEELKEKFIYKDFPHFIDLWCWKNKFIDKADDFEEITYQVLSDLHKQNVKYAEIFYSPIDFIKNKLTIENITDSLLIGRHRAFQDFGIKSQFIMDLVRDTGPDNGMEYLERVKNYLGKGIIGIGLGGSEQSYPPEKYRYIYEKAKQLGFRLTAHAGEAAGAKSVWNALKHLNIERIGHGVRAREDRKLIQHLKKTQIPLEVCVVSNIKTGVYNSIEEHPIREYFNNGLFVTINSDDPVMFNTTISNEYYVLMDKFGFNPLEIKKLTFNSIEASFLPVKEKDALIQDFEIIWQRINSKYDIE